MTRAYGRFLSLNAKDKNLRLSKTKVCRVRWALPTSIETYSYAFPPSYTIRKAITASAHCSLRAAFIFVECVILPEKGKRGSIDYISQPNATSKGQKCKMNNR